MRVQWLHRGFLIVAVFLIAAVTVAQEKPLPPVIAESDIGLEVGLDGPDALWPGPDGFGYSGQAVAYNWIEISTTGTAIPGLTDDSFAGPFPIGFTFGFYGTDWTDFYVSSNGFISFGAGSTSLSNQCPLPNSSAPNNIIAMLWDDLNFTVSGNAYYQTFATCPVGTGQCLVVEYSNVAHYGGTAGSAGTWEAILFDDGNVRIQYLDPGVEFGSGSTEGIEGNNFAAGYGLTYACDTASSLTAGLAIEYMFPTGVMLNPPAAAKAGCEGSDVYYTLFLTNYTGSDATFDFSYSSNWPIGGPSSWFVANGDTWSFDVAVSIPCGGTSDVATVTASGNGYSDTTTLTTSVTAGGFTAWEAIDSINSLGRSRPAAAGVDGKVYLFGGEITGGREDTVEMFDPAAGVWVDMLGLMPVPASNICAAAIGTDVYIPGGYDAAGAYMTALQVYHTTTDSWETIATDPLPAPKAGPGCAAVGGKLYVYGGVTTGGSYTNTAFVYDPAAAAGSRWSALPNMTYTRAYLAGAAVNGKVYAVGGRDSATVNFNYVEAFDPADGLWHTVTPMTTARGGPGAMFWGDLLVACGGGWSTYLNTCESYDTTQGYAGSWTNLASTMIQGRRTYAYASLPEALYAVAGYNGAFLQTAERLPAFTCPPCVDPDIDVSPLSLDATQPPDTTTQQTLTITNTGGQDLTWSLSEVPAVKSVAVKPVPAGTPKSLTGSYVAFDPSVGGDTCYTPSTAETFCFRAESFSPDYEYVYNLWEKFPADWVVSNVYVVGTPWCDNGTWGTFSWSFQTSPYEVNIAHSRYQGSGGAHCIAYYCFDAAAGAGPADVGVSWYWDGDGYANPPHNPCSNDGYTPAGQNACDEMINPVATVPACVTGIAWLSESPTSGTVPPGATVDITVTFDSTGLAAGGYVGDLEISSNDPDPGPGNGTNLVVVPVTLTVIQVGDPDIEVTPPSLFASQMTNTITQQVLNIGNVGQVDLGWDIFEEGVVLANVQVTIPAGPAQAPEGTAVATGSYEGRSETSYTVVRHGPVMQPPNVLLLYSDYGATAIQALLQAYGDLGALDLFDAAVATPSLAQLQAYDVVVTWTNFTYLDPVGIGNVLADYVDAGGNVINLMFAIGVHGWEMQGRFMDEGYTAMNGTSLTFANICLGTYNPGHPIMAGVTNVCEYYRMTGTYLTAGSSEVAQWADGLLFVAVKDDQSVVSINGYVGDVYQWTGQMPDVLHNAILWVEGAQQICTNPTDVSWLSEAPTSGITAPGGSTPVDVYFDSTGIPVGIYEANLCVVSNDPDEPIVPVPVTMEVVIPVELMGISVE